MGEEPDRHAPSVATQFPVDRENLHHLVDSHAHFTEDAGALTDLAIQCAAQLDTDNTIGIRHDKMAKVIASAVRPIIAAPRKRPFQDMQSTVDADRLGDPIRGGRENVIAGADP